MSSTPEGTGSSTACWFVGATYDGTDDQMPRFLREGIWENGYRKMRQQAVMSLWQAGWTEDDIRLYGGWSRCNSRGKDAFDHYFNREMALWIKQGQHSIDLKWWKDFAVQLAKVA